MLDKEKRVLLAVSGDTELCILPKMANRHGLITGATGTGKTVTLQSLAESFSQMGVPVFAADVKGDLSGAAAKGGAKQSVVERVAQCRLEEKGFAFQAFPVQFWDVFGEQGAPVRAAIGDMGPLLLSRLLSLNDTQTAVLTLIFKIAADEKMPLVDLKDLRHVLAYVADNAKAYAASYGNVSAASAGAIQRGLAALEHEGAGAFFGEPALNIDDLLKLDGGKGIINILASDRLVNSPKLYAACLFWLMTRLFDLMPEVGDADKPSLVFFFDEAHLMFDDAPKALVDKIEQVTRLIRSKGVGIYFISQSPADMPDAVLGQLGNRVQHALRAYTPKDRKNLRAAAQSFRENPSFDAETAISQLGTGEALISFLDEKGAPRPVERALILPPQSRIGPLEASARADMMQSSLNWSHYAQAKDRESAFEILDGRMRDKADAEKESAREKEESKAELQRRKFEEKIRAAREKEAAREAKHQGRFWMGVAKSILAPLARQALGALFKRK